MTDPLDRNGDRPLYKQVADRIRAQIVSGELRANSDLPSERQLAEEYAVGGTTIKDALMLLKAEGLLLSERGRPWRVRPIHTSVADRYALGERNYGPDVESNFAREHGVPWSRFDLDRDYRIIGAPARVAANLRISAGDKVCERRWTHIIDGVILRVSWSYLDMARFANTILTDFNEPPWPGGTMAQLKHLGYNIDHSIEHAGVATVTSDEARLLAVEPGKTVLRHWRTLYAGGSNAQLGAPIETARRLYPRGKTELGYDIGLYGRGWIDWHNPPTD